MAGSILMQVEEDLIDGKNGRYGDIESLLILQYRRIRVKQTDGCWVLEVDIPPAAAR